MSFIRSLFPNADYSDPTWISVNTCAVSEVLVADKDPVWYIGFRNPSWELIQDIYSAKGWRGLDPSNGQIIPPFIPPEYYGFSAE